MREGEAFFTSRQSQSAVVRGPPHLCFTGSFSCRLPTADRRLKLELVVRNMSSVIPAATLFTSVMHGLSDGLGVGFGGDGSPLSPCRGERVVHDYFPVDLLGDRVSGDLADVVSARGR